MSEPQKQPRKKKRSAATGKGNIRNFVKSVDPEMSVSREGIKVLNSIAHAEVADITSAAVDTMQCNGDKTLTTHSAAAGVKMRYTDQDIRDAALHKASAHTDKYNNSYN